jgi:predicted AAA+ superfamily ATPase
MSTDHSYLINHSDATLAKPVLYLRKYWTSMIESTRRSQKFFYVSGIRRLGKKSIMSHIARCDTDYKVIMIHADMLDREWKDNVSNIIEFLQYSVEQYETVDVFIGEVELLSNYELLLDYIAQE